VGRAFCRSDAQAIGISSATPLPHRHSSSARLSPTPHDDRRNAHNPATPERGNIRNTTNTRFAETWTFPHCGNGAMPQ